MRITRDNEGYRELGEEPAHGCPLSAARQTCAGLVLPEMTHTGPRPREP
jgi:hypothetical protein